MPAQQAVTLEPHFGAGCVVGMAKAEVAMRARMEVSFIVALKSERKDLGEWDVVGSLRVDDAMSPVASMAVYIYTYSLAKGRVLGVPERFLGLTERMTMLWNDKRAGFSPFASGLFSLLSPIPRFGD